MGLLSEEKFDFILHDINSFLGTLLLLTDLCLDPETTPDEQSSYLSLIKKNIQECSMLTQSSISVFTDKEVVSVKTEIQLVLHLLEADLKGTLVILEGDDAALPVSIFSCRRVFLNLVLNANEAMNGVQNRELRIRIEKDNVLKIHFINNNNEEKIQDKTQSRRVHFGLGLPFIKKTVEEWKGKFILKKSENETKCTIEIPYVKITHP